MQPHFDPNFCFFFSTISSLIPILPLFTAEESRPIKMDRLLDISHQKEEEKCMVSALSHVISGGVDDNSNARTPPPATQTEPEGYHHHHHPVPVLGGPPLVFSTGESSSAVKKKKIKSGKEYRGVRRRGNKWVAEIWDPHQGKVQWLSSFATAEEAARAYDRKAIEYRGVAGAFPYMNFPLEDYGYPSYNLGTNNNVQTTITQIAAGQGAGGPGQFLSTSAGTNESAPPHSSTAVTELQDNINNNITAAEDDPLLLLNDFDDYTLQQFMALANSL